MKEKETSDIFNYDFDWYVPKKKKSTREVKEICCEKYLKKGEKKCKSCPKRVA